MNADASHIDLDIFYDLAKKLAYLQLFGNAPFETDGCDEAEANYARTHWARKQILWDRKPCPSPFRPSNSSFDHGHGQDWANRNGFVKFAPTCNSDYGSSENVSVADDWDCGNGCCGGGDVFGGGDFFDDDAANSPNKSFEELASAFRPEIPRPGYICNICRIPGHFIQYCPQAPTVTKTPYQGTKQCIGLFICHKCKRQWKSNKSFAGVGQQCKKCHVIVNPKKQFPLHYPPRSILPRQLSPVDSIGQHRCLMVTPTARNAPKPLPSLTSDFFESCSALATPSPSPLSTRQFVYE